MNTYKKRFDKGKTILLMNTYTIIDQLQNPEPHRTGQNLSSSNTKHNIESRKGWYGEAHLFIGSPI